MKQADMQGLIDVLQNNKIMGEQHGTRWLNAHEDRSAGVRVFSGRCMALCDAAGTGDHGLIVAETKLPALNGRLRVYRGAATLCSDRPLHGPPSALVAFYTDDLEPRVPAVAVAVGGDVLIYKNSKPFFKWSAPTMPASALELEVWRRLTEGEYEPGALPQQLQILRSLPFGELSTRSQRLLTLSDSKPDTESTALEEFIGRYVQSGAPTRAPVVTCLAELTRSSASAAACLVAATEAGHVYFLDPQAFRVLHEANVGGGGNSAGVALMACSGLFDVEFRCVVCTRDGCLRLLRREWLEGRRLLQVPTGAAVVDLVLVPGDQNIVMALADGRLLGYTKRGKKLWTIQMGGNAGLTCLSLVPLRHLNTCLVATGARPGVIQLYQGRHLVDTLHIFDTPAAMRFGRLGQEDNVLVIITSDGSLLFKILKRTADFSVAASQAEGAPGAGATPPARPLPLPKRSKLFAEQAQRERLHSSTIHQAFQQDLIRLRLRAGRSVATNITTSTSTNSPEAQHPSVKLSAQVLGLGPRFTLTLTVENLSSERAAGGLAVVLHVPPSRYVVQTPFVPVPLLPPERRHQVESTVTEVLGGGEQNELPETPIRVFVMVKGQAQPLLAAAINMPPTDPLAFLI